MESHNNREDMHSAIRVIKRMKIQGDKSPAKSTLYVFYHNTSTMNILLNCQLLKNQALENLHVGQTHLLNYNISLSSLSLLYFRLLLYWNPGARFLFLHTGGLSAEYRQITEHLTSQLSQET